MIIPYKVIYRIFFTLYGIITSSLSANFSRARYDIPVAPQFLPNIIVAPQFLPNIIVAPQFLPNIIVAPQFLPYIIVALQSFPNIPLAHSLCFLHSFTDYLKVLVNFMLVKIDGFLIVKTVICSTTINVAMLLSYSRVGYSPTGRVPIGKIGKEPFLRT